MLARIIWVGVAVLAFASSAYAQGIVPAGSGAPGQNRVPTLPATVDTGASLPNVARPAETTRSNPELVKKRVEREFERTQDTFVTPSVDIGIEGAGIALPKCVSETQEGKRCK